MRRNKKITTFILTVVACCAITLISAPPSVAQPSAPGFGDDVVFQPGSLWVNGYDNKGFDQDFIEVELYWLGAREGNFMLASFSPVTRAFQPIHDDEHLFLVYDGERQTNVDWLSAPAVSEKPVNIDSPLWDVRSANPNLVLRLTGLDPNQCFGLFGKYADDEQFPTTPLLFWSAGHGFCDRRLLRTVGA